MNICSKYVDSRRISTTDIKIADSEELLELKSIIDGDILAINDQLGKARTERITNGTYADPDWYRRAMTAKGAKGQLSQRIQNELRLRRKENSQQRMISDSERKYTSLVQALHLVLTAEQVDEVVQKARELRRSSNDAIVNSTT